MKLFITFDYLLIHYKPHLLGFIYKQKVMSRSTYISENLTQNHLDFIRFLDDVGVDYKIRVALTIDYR